MLSVTPVIESLIEKVAHDAAPRDVSALRATLPAAPTAHARVRARTARSAREHSTPVLDLRRGITLGNALYPLSLDQVRPPIRRLVPFRRIVSDLRLALKRFV